MDQSSPFAARARDFTVAALAAAYPSKESLAILEQMDLRGHEGLDPLLRAARSGVAELQAEYSRVFDTGKGRVPLYETEFGRMRGLAKGRDLADVSGFYHAFGFELSTEDGTEMPDHIAVELEFYALLLYKQVLLAEDSEGTQIVQRARHSFLEQHLGAFPRAIADRPSVADHTVYGPLLCWVAGLVETECRAEAVTAAPLDFFDHAGEDGEVSCGACVTLPTPQA